MLSNGGEGTRTPGAPPTLLRGKLSGLPPGPAALLPRTRPSHGIYGKEGTDTVFTETVTETATETDTGMNTGTATYCWKPGVTHDWALRLNSRTPTLRRSFVAAQKTWREQ